jgi:hypothetical protein
VRKENDTMKKLVIITLSLLAFIFLTAQTCTWGYAGYSGDYCEDEIEDSDETDVDCGGTYCDPCEEGQNCDGDEDCETDLICDDAVCVGVEETDCGNGYCNFYETYSSCSDDCSELTEYTLADWPDMFRDEDYEFTGLLVVGNDTIPEDVIAITNIATGLQTIYDGEAEDGTSVVVPLSVSAVYLDSEIDDPYAQDLILLGTQCYNNIINDVLGYDEDTCAESIQDEGTAIIKLLVTETNKILIISGYTGSDTRLAGEFMSDEVYYSDLEGAEAIIDTSDKDSLSIISTAN